MPQSKSDIYLHIVWATYRRMPLISREIERNVHRCIEATFDTMGVKTLDVNGVEDHVHLAIILPTTVTVAEMMKRVKGVSSTVARTLKKDEDNLFKWQDVYAVFSFHRKDSSAVIRYIERQKERHAKGELFPEWEPSATNDAD